MDSVHDTPKGWVAPFGHPRIKACSRLPMAFRSVPRPSSPPGAKASTECPSLARNTHPRTILGQSQSARGLHHARKPSTENAPPSRHDPQVYPLGSRAAAAGLASVPPHGRPLAQHTIRSASPSAPDHTRPEEQATAQALTHPTDRSNAPEHSPRRRWGAMRITHTTHPVRHAPTQRNKPAPKRRSLTATTPGTSRLARPETHQNLIHTDKDHHDRKARPPTRRARTPGTLCPGA